MKITIEEAIPAKNGLALRLRVSGKNHDWVQFRWTMLMYNELSQAERDQLCQWLCEYMLDEQRELQQVLDWG